MEDRCVSVIGAGVMGRDLVYCFLRASYSVIAVDSDPGACDNLWPHVQRSHVLMRMLGHPHADGAAIDSMRPRLRVSPSLRSIEGCGLVIESASESIKVKKSIFSELKDVLDPGCLVATNTSCVPIGMIGDWLGNPGSVVGLHFMNPATLSKMVEVVVTDRTSVDARKRALDVLAELGKRGIVVNDGPGFVTNSVLMTTINESIFLIESGRSCAKDIDALFREGLGHKMGPLETADLIGLDTILASLGVLLELIPSPKYAACPLLRSMVSEGALGRKSGQGFYSY